MKRASFKHITMKLSCSHLKKLQQYSNRSRLPGRRMRKLTKVGLRILRRRRFRRRWNVPRENWKAGAGPHRRMRFPLQRLRRRLTKYPLKRPRSLRIPSWRIFSSKFSQTWMLLQEVPEAEDLRRRQLTMRATEKGKAEEQKELQKVQERKQKECECCSKTKTEGDDLAKQKVMVKKGWASNPGRGSKKMKMRMVMLPLLPRPNPRRRIPRMARLAQHPRRQRRRPKPRERLGAGRMLIQNMTQAWWQDMVDLMCTYLWEAVWQDKGEHAQGVHEREKTRIWVSIYWNRPAGGVKIMEGDKESQKFYFSYCYSSIAVHIYMCNKMAERWVLKDAEWPFNGWSAAAVPAAVGECHSGPRRSLWSSWQSRCC